METINKLLNGYEVIYTGKFSTTTYRLKDLDCQQLIDVIEHITIYPERYKVA